MTTVDMLMNAQEDETWKKTLYIYLNNVMRRADFGIHGVNIKIKEFDLEKMELPSDMPESVRKEILRNPKGSLEVEFNHRAEPTGKEVRFSSLDESNGTRRFFELSGPWLLALVLGRALLVDELEASLHPHLVRELINFIQNRESSRKGAQLIFTTHDTTLLDPELFRRDQIWFTEKDKHGSTRLYSMLDYKPRKGEAMQKGYLSGRYGAIPIIEAFGLNG